MLTSIASLLAYLASLILRFATGTATALARIFAFAGDLLIPALSRGGRAAHLVPPTVRHVALAVTAVGFMGVAATGAYVFGAALTNPYLGETLGYAHDRQSALEIRDADDRFLGILPPSFFDDVSDGSKADLPPDHAAAIPESIPNVWRQCAIELEDHRFNGLSAWLGVDPIAIAKSGIDTLVGDRKRGASTLRAQAVRSLSGLSPGSHEAMGSLVFRKGLEIFGSPALARMVHDHDVDGLMRLIAMHVGPLVIGSTGSRFGDPIYSIELASQVLLGKSAKDLTDVEQAIVAAMIKYPLVSAPLADRDARQLVASRWRQIRERAAKCLQFQKDGSASELRNEQILSGMDVPSPVDVDGIRPLLPKDDVSAWSVAVNPVRRALWFEGEQLPTIKESLDAQFGGDWRGRVVSVRLTTSARDNVNFSRAVDAALARSSAAVSISSATADLADPSVNILVAVGDDHGRVRGLFANHPNLFFSWRSPIASVAKMIAAVAVSNRGDTLATQYCAIDPPSKCRRMRGWISARTAFATSNSIAVKWALQRIPAAELMRIANVFRVSIPNGTPPATALAYGELDFSPAETLRMVRAVAAGISDSPTDVPLPKLVDRISTLTNEGHIAQVLPAIPGDVITKSDLRRLFSVSVRLFVAGALSATSDSDGTLRSLGGIKRIFGGKFYAKTGTVAVSGHTLAIHIAGVFPHGHELWTFLVSIGTRNGNPIGRGLEAGKFAGVVRAAILSLISERQA